MSDKLPADWAIERALEIGNAEMYSPHSYGNPAAAITLNVVKTRAAHGNYFRIIAFARYIEEHEEPPVSKELLAARKAYVSTYPKAEESIMAGRHDRAPTMRTCLTAIYAYKEMCHG